MAPPPSPAEQQARLQQLKERCLSEQILTEQSALFADSVLFRFLRARQWNVNNAKVMLRDCQKWIDTVGGDGMDELYRRLDPLDYPERADVFKHWPLWFHKTDKKGRPVNVHSFGSVNTSELYKIVSPERFLDILAVNCESLTREVLPGCSNLAGRPIESVLVIVDLKGFSLGQFWQMKDLARKSFQISQDYYPETMGQLKIINAPSSFTTMWSVIKLWLAPETVEKVDILGQNYHSELLKLVDAENLPCSLGGECTCADCGGCEFSSVGPWLLNRKQRKEDWLARKRPDIGLGMEEKDEAGRMGRGVENGTNERTYSSRAGNVTPGAEDDSEFVLVGEHGKDSTIEKADQNSPEETSAPDKQNSGGEREPQSKQDAQSDKPDTSTGIRPTPSSPGPQSKQDAQSDKPDTSTGIRPTPSSPKPSHANGDDSPASRAAGLAARAMRGGKLETNSAPSANDDDEKPVEDDDTKPKKSPPSLGAAEGPPHHPVAAVKFMRDELVNDDDTGKPSETPASDAKPTTSANGILPPGLEPSVSRSANFPAVVTAPPETNQAIVDDGKEGEEGAVKTPTEEKPREDKDRQTQDSNGNEESSMSAASSSSTFKRRSRLSKIIAKIVHPTKGKDEP